MTDKERLKRLQVGSVFNNDDINFLLRQAELCQSLVVSESYHRSYIKELQEEKEIWKERSESLLEGLADSLKWYEVAYKRYDKFREVLRFYAREDIYEWETYYNPQQQISCMAIDDGGYAARKILEEFNYEKLSEAESHKKDS